MNTLNFNTDSNETMRSQDITRIGTYWLEGGEDGHSSSLHY